MYDERLRRLHIARDVKGIRSHKKNKQENKKEELSVWVCTATRQGRKSDQVVKKQKPPPNYPLVSDHCQGSWGFLIAGSRTTTAAAWSRSWLEPLPWKDVSLTDMYLCQPYYNHRKSLHSKKIRAWRQSEVVDGPMKWTAETRNHCFDGYCSISQVSISFHFQPQVKTLSSTIILHSTLTTVPTGAQTRTFPNTNQVFWCLKNKQTLIIVLTHIFILPCWSVALVKWGEKNK